MSYHSTSHSATPFISQQPSLITSTTQHSPSSTLSLSSSSSSTCTTNSTPSPSTTSTTTSTPFLAPSSLHEHQCPLKHIHQGVEGTEEKEQESTTNNNNNNNNKFFSSTATTMSMTLSCSAHAPDHSCFRDRAFGDGTDNDAVGSNTCGNGSEEHVPSDAPDPYSTVRRQQEQCGQPNHSHQQPINYHHQDSMILSMDNSSSSLRNRSQLPDDKNDNNTHLTTQPLNHPHIIYPTMSPQSQDDIHSHSHSSPVQPRSSTKRDSLQRRFSFDNKSTPFNFSTSGSCSSTDWDSDMDRTTMRGLDSSSSEDDDDDDASEEQSESDSDRRRFSSQQHLPVSVKRRKVSVDEDYERLHLLEQPDEIETRPINTVSSNKQQQLSHSISSTSTSSSSPLSNVHRRISSTATTTAVASTRPSSWPARKRRSFIAEPKSTSTASTFSFSEPPPEEPSSSSSLSSTAGLDTSSLSLLCETSALVSEGTIPSENNDNASLRALLEPSSSFSSPSLSSSLSASSPSTRCFSLTLSADSPFLSADRAQFNAQELLESISPPSSTSSSSASFSLSPAANDPATSTTMTTTTSTMTQSLQSSRRQRYQQQSLLGTCRKRTFEDAIELTRPLGNDPSTEHAGWLGSIKRRKIHHFPTRWTSTLSPSPYIKLLAMRDFWDVMMSRMDLSWLDLWTASGSNATVPLRRFDGDSEMEESDGDDEQEVESGQSSIGSDAETERSDEMDTEQDGACLPSDSRDSRTAITKEQQYSAAPGPISKAVSNLRKSNTDHDDAGESIWSMCATLRRKKRTVVQHPSAALFLRGLWEEEEHCRRQKQMIPESVHKPIRSKVLNRKPLLRTTATASKSPSNKSQALNTGSGSTSSSKDASSSTSVSSSPSSSLVKESGSPSTSSSHPTESSADQGDSNDKDKNQEETEAQGSASNGGDQGTVLRKKYGPSAALRSNALSEGYDLNEYKPWKDATITPHQGCIQTLRKMRCTMLEPWPLEESRAKDECSRILHVMREQLNVVINLQIHLRSMIKTAPQQMSFLLSIRHPGQISIELLNALYGPQFMQTNAFRSIEQLLWGKNHCWKALDSSSALSLQHHRPPAQLARYTSSSSSCSQGSRSSSYPQQQQHHQHQQRQQYPDYSYHHHDPREADDEHDSMFDGAEDVQHDHRHHRDYQEHHYQDYHDGHDEEYDEHHHQYPQHDHNGQAEYHESTHHSYYDQRHHHHQQQYSSSRHYHHQDDVTHSASTLSSLQYSRTAMEDVSECEFEDEFDESPYQDTLLEIDPIDITSSYSETEDMVVEKQGKKKSVVTTMMAKDGGYESGGDVSEGEVEALEISSSSSSSLDARTFQR